MAEGLMRALFGDKFESYSAGTVATRVNPLAIKVMAEIGIDISHHRSKSVEEFRGWEFDYVVTVCDQAKESCPFFPGARKYLHKGFEDPSQYEGDEAIQKFREVRDEIKEWLIETFS